MLKNVTLWGENPWLQRTGLKTGWMPLSFPVAGLPLSQHTVPPLCLLAILGLPSHLFSLISELGNGQFYLSVSSTEESTLFLMHPASVFPGPFPHTPIVCRTIRDLAGELIQEHNLFQTKCTLFPPGQLNRNKSVQNQ